MTIKKTTQNNKKPKKIVQVAPCSHGVGRRKSSVARVWLRRGNGLINVNDRNFTSYFHTDLSQKTVVEPLAMIGKNADSFSIDINVYGGGVHSQAGASRLAISRALAKYSEEFKQIMKENKALTVNSKKKERKKYGQKGARRGFQFVKR